MSQIDKIIKELLKKIDNRIPLGADRIYVEKDIEDTIDQILEAIKETDHQEIFEQLHYLKEDVAEIRSEIKK